MGELQVLSYEMIMIYEKGRNNWKAHSYLDKYSVTIDRFGGSVTAPMNRTIFGCLRLFIIATYHIEKSIHKVTNMDGDAP